VTQLKPKFELIPPAALEEVALVLAVGGEQYEEADGEDKWRSRTTRQLLGSAFRHLWRFMRGEEVDPGTGRHHLACAAARVLMALDKEVGG